MGVTLSQVSKEVHSAVKNDVKPKDGTLLVKNSSLFDNSTTIRENDPEPDVSFVQPKYVQKKLKKQEARRKGIIMGTAANSHRIKGAPEPDRHLFETDDDALRD